MFLKKNILYYYQYTLQITPKKCENIQSDILAGFTVTSY